MDALWGSFVSVLSSKGVSDMTYIDPKDNKTQMNIFCRGSIIVFQTMIPGKIANDKSVMIVDAVDVYDSAIMVPEPAHSPSPVQFAETGRQSRSTPIKVTSMVAMVKASSV